MTEVHTETVVIPEMKAPVPQEMAKKNKIEKRIKEITTDQKMVAERSYHSFLSFMGYLAAGVALWFVMQRQFMFVFPNNADVLDELLRFKDLWNVAMYVVPYCFWGMAIKNASILIMTTVVFCFSEFELYRLKKKLAK